MVVNYHHDLKKTDTGWVYQGKFFSGYMVEKETNGRIVYTLPIIKGKENGLATGIYNTGEKLLERNFVQGKKEGDFIQWWPNGHYRYLYHYRNNVYHGLQRVYFPDGKMRQESNYVNGEEEGLQRVWNQQGELVSNYTIKDKKLYGVIKVKSCIANAH
jgi:antitoxin component YwqK of YwqJK toxin-antitoxin module